MRPLLSNKDSCVETCIIFQWFIIFVVERVSLNNVRTKPFFLSSFFLFRFFLFIFFFLPLSHIPCMNIRRRVRADDSRYWPFPFSAFSRPNLFYAPLFWIISVCCPSVVHRPSSTPIQNKFISIVRVIAAVSIVIGNSCLVSAINEH
jgi:hypothetical protein